MSPGGERFLQSLMALEAACRVNARIGADAFVYEGVQGKDDAALTIWRFDIYGGAKFGGDKRAPMIESSRIWVTTSRPTVSNWKSNENF